MAEFDFMIDPSLIGERNRLPNVQELLNRAIDIRRQKIERCSPDTTSSTLRLTKSQGIWTPINYDRGIMYRISVTIYSSQDGAVVSADENMDINRTMTTVFQQEPFGEAEEARRKVLKGIENNWFRNIAIMNAHGENTYDNGLRYWGYYGQSDKPLMVYQAVRTMSLKHDLIVLAVCNPGRIKLPESCSVEPLFYCLGSINANKNIPGTKLVYNGSLLLG